MGNLNHTPVDWTTAFGGLSAWNLNTELRDPFTQLEGGWTSYTPWLQQFTTQPTWSGSGGVQQGMFHRFGKTVMGRVFLKCPSAYANGTGNFYVTLPDGHGGLGNPMASPGGIPYNVGSGYLWDSSAPEMWTLNVRTWSSNVFTLYITATTAALYNFGPTNPITLASGDEIGFTFCYELA